MVSQSERAPRSACPTALPMGEQAKCISLKGGGGVGAKNKPNMDADAAALCWCGRMEQQPLGGFYSPLGQKWQKSLRTLLRYFQSRESAGRFYRSAFPKLWSGGKIQPTVKARECSGIDGEKGCNVSLDQVQQTYLGSCFSVDIYLQLQSGTSEISHLPNKFFLFGRLNSATIRCHNINLTFNCCHT